MCNQRISTPIAGAIVLAALSASGTTLAGEREYEWITDPVQLEARGFNPDGPPLRRLVPASDTRSKEERLAERRAREQRAGSAEVGGPGVNWATVQASDFRFLSESALYNTGGDYYLSIEPGTPNRFADAPILLKDDRRLMYLDVWTHDTNPARGVDVALYEVCQPPFTGAAAEVTELAMVEGGSESGGNAFNWATIPVTYVDNRVCVYYVRAMFSIPVDYGDDVRLQKVRVYWNG
jgi:hypothetical protein